MTAHGALARAALMPSEPPRIGAPGEFPSVASSGAMGDIGGYDSNLKQDACGGAVNIASLRARSRDPNRHIPVKGAIPSLELSRLHLGKFDPDVYTTRGSIEKSWVRPPFQGESTSHRDFSAPPVDSLRAALRHADPQSSSYSWHQSRKFEGASLSHTDFAPPPLHALLAAYRAPSHDAAGAEPRSRSFDPFRSRRMDLESEGSRRHGSVPPPIEALPRGADSDRLKASSLSGDAKAKFTYDPLIHSGVEPPKLDQLDAGDALANRAREKFTQEGRRDPHLPVWPQDIHARQYSQVESTTHHDFRPPPLDVLRAALHSPQAEENSAWKQKLQQYRCPFQGKSSMHQDFPPPPAEALRAINKQPDGCPHDDVFSAARAVFTGESTTHTDFPALPLDALRAALRHSERGAESKEFKAAFAGESSTHRDFTPPPLDAIRSARSRGESTTRRDFLSPPVDALRFSGDSSMHHDYRLPHEQRMKLEHVPRLKFEGESSTHRDFPPHPAAALDVGVTESNRYNWFSERAKFEGQSTLHRDFPPPPLDALRNAMPAHQLDRDDHSLRNDVKFEGESLTHRDFKAPPPSALRADFLADLQKPSNSEWKARCIFTGESSTHRDYQPPSLEALRETFCLPDAQARSKEETFAKFRFEGKSTTHTDFTSHVHAASQERPYLEVSHEVHQDKPRFEGESSTHRDFLPPPMEALRNAFAVHQSDDMAPSLKSDMKFQGESSMRRDFQPPPPMPFSADVISDQQRPSNHAWQERTVFTGESSTHRDFVPPPLDALRSVFSVHQSDYPNQLMEQNVKFEGESSMHRDFKAPPSSALRADFMADLRKPSNIEWKEQGPFTGESSAHRDYQPPSLEALRETFCLPGAQARSKEETYDKQFRFEGKSTTHTDFTPRAIERLRSTPRRIAEQIGAFCGESTTHRDFQAPLNAASREDSPYIVRRTPPAKEPAAFAGESSTHRDFQPPPLDALRATFDACQSQSKPLTPKDAKKFEGESSTHLAFQAPPREALLESAMVSPGRRDCKSVRGSVPFCGESSCHRDYRAPSLEALRSAFQLPQPQVSARGSQRHSSSERIAFSGQSATHCDFTPPPRESILAAFQRDRTPRRREDEGRKLFCVEDLVKSRASEAQSTSHRDFAPPLRESSIAAGRRTPNPKRESSVDLKFIAPAHESLQGVAKRRASSEDPNFRRMSSTHRDFTPPPRESLLLAFQNERQVDCRRQAVSEKLRFQGESSMRQHFVAPPQEALRAAFQTPGAKAMPSDSLKFESQSSTHRDFTPPPPDPRQTAAGRPTRTNKENADPAKPASSRPVEILYKQPVAKFGEQHAMHRNKLLETNQGAVATTSLQKQDRVVHFASSLTHNDSRAETCSSLSKTLPAGYPTRPNENRSKSAPRERSQHSSRAAGMLLGGSTRNSTPETTSRHDFRPVLSLTAAAAGKSTGKGQRSHSTPADSRPVMASGGNISQSLAKVPPSSVQSSAHRDFTPPPREAYEEPLKRLGAKRAQQPLQESRDFATTSRAAFTSHPSKPSAMSSTGSCPAHHVWSSLPPPKPPSGRE